MSQSISREDAEKLLRKNRQRREIYQDHIPYRELLAERAQTPTVETDEALRLRLCDAIPQGATYTAEDIGTASGEQLDAIAAQHNVKRKGLS